MKTILVPTDYSETADNALQYAVELAKFSKAKIILFHSYHIPIPTTEAPVMLISPQELEKENNDRIKKLEKQISKQTAGKIKIESIVRAGFVPDEVKNAANEKKADLIVMGITGAGKVAQTLMGSNATSLIKKTQVPVLVIPKNVKYKKIEKIVLAYDYSGEMEESVMKKLKGFIQLFKAKLMVVDVVKPVEVPTNENAVSSLSLENALRGIKHTLYFPEAENMEDEINSFSDSYKADWLVMIPHKHKLLSGLFHKSNTKQMAFHTSIPLLSLHE